MQNYISAWNGLSFEFLEYQVCVLIVMDFPSNRSDKSVEQGRHPARLLALDFSTTGIKAARLKKMKDRIESACLKVFGLAALAGMDII